MQKGNFTVSKKLQSNIMLFITAFIWGSAFVAQKDGMNYLGPFAFNGIRTLIGAVVLIPVIMVLGSVNKKSNQAKKLTDEEKSANRKLLIIGGILCGLILFVASSLQQVGLAFGADAGKSGFITSLYIVLVPLIGVFIGKRIRPIIWLCVALGAVGLYLLTMKGDLVLAKGDFFIMLCALAFSAHILVIDYFSPRTDGVKLSCIQFFVAGLASLVIMSFTEMDTVSLTNIKAAAFPLFYTGALSSGVAYTLQIVAQKHAEPSVASLIMSLESVFAVISGMVILGETMAFKEILGCIIMFTAIILAQLPTKEEKLAAKES